MKLTPKLLENFASAHAAVLKLHKVSLLFYWWKMYEVMTAQPASRGSLSFYDEMNESLGLVEIIGCAPVFPWWYRQKGRRGFATHPPQVIQPELCVWMSRWTEPQGIIFKALHIFFIPMQGLSHFRQLL